MNIPNYLFNNTLRNQAIRIALGKLFTQPGIKNYSDATIAAKIGSSETTVRRYRHAAQDAGLYDSSKGQQQIEFPYFAVNICDYLYRQMRHHIASPFDQETLEYARQIVDVIIYAQDGNRKDAERIMETIKELEDIVTLKKELNERVAINRGTAAVVKMELKALYQND